MDCLKIVSCNVRGLGNDMKRREIFHYLHVNNYDIVLFQESHSALHLQKRRRNKRWGGGGGRALFSNGTTQARGVMILISKDVPIYIHNSIKDKEGRFLAIDVTYGHTRLTIANIYAPNLDAPGFFMNTFNKIDEIGNQHKIIAGDYNLILNDDLCYRNRERLRSNGILIISKA